MPQYNDIIINHLKFDKEKFDELAKFVKIFPHQNFTLYGICTIDSSIPRIANYPYKVITSSIYSFALTLQKCCIYAYTDTDIIT